MSRPRSRFGGTRNYAWFILLASLAVFGVSLWIRLARVPKPTELERLVAQNEPDEHIHALAAAPDGTTYVGTHLGVIAGKARKAWTRLPGFSGDLLAIQASPDGKLYLGGDFGLVSYSGERTEAVLANSVTALSVDPKDPQRLIAFVKGTGLMVSPDGGRTWSLLAPFKDHGILTVAIDPHDPNRIAVGGYSGFLTQSSDGGRTWYNLGSYQETVTSLLFDPVRPGRLWGAIGGVVRFSDDGGATWRAAPDAPADRPVVALGPSGDPKRPVLAATSQGYLYTPSPK